jgi:hypothetical protein
MANPKDEVALELSRQRFALPALSRERFLDPVQDSDGHPAVELA